jgi:hypothetical protein
MRGIWRTRFRSWLAMFLSLSLLVMVAAPAAAAPASNLTLPQKLKLLQDFNVVRGDGNGDMQLYRPIKRAEMVAIVLRAMGKDAQAAEYQGLGLFLDTRGHWADGYLSLGRSIGLVKGDGNNNARPEDPISYAEAYTLVLRAVDKEPSAGSWPVNVFLSAQEANLLPEGMTFQAFTQPAVRVDIFAALADALLTFQKADGKTYFEAYLNPPVPSLTVDTLPATTAESTVKVTGQATGATAVTVNGAAATLSGGKFEATVNLTSGANRLVVQAANEYGFSVTKELTIAKAAPFSRLTIQGPSAVGLGTTTNYLIKAFNSQDQEVSPTGLTAQVEGSIGTFDAATGKFTAATVAGSGKITVTAGGVSASVEVKVSGQAATVTGMGIQPFDVTSYSKPLVVKVEVRDINGDRMSEDYGRQISLTASGGAVVLPTVANTEAGVATFTVRVTSPGSVNLLATASGLPSVQDTAEFTTTTRVVLSTVNPQLVVGGTVTSSRIRADLQDESGNAVTNSTENDITILLSSSTTDGYLADNVLTIRRGMSSSTAGGDDGLFVSGSIGGNVTLSGELSSNHNYTVVATKVSITIPGVGAGAHYEINGPAGNLTPGGAPGTFNVRAVDAAGNTISGEFAFQVSAKTSNGETGDALANALTVTLGDSGRSPLSDGKSESSTDDGPDIIARTRGGNAILYVSYDKPGIVTLTVTGVAATQDSYNDGGQYGSATTGTGLAFGSEDAYWYTVPTKVVLKADSEGFGKDQTLAAGGTSKNRTITLRAYFTDDDGNWVPGTGGTVAVQRAAGGDGDNTYYSGSALTATVTDGTATFTVSTTNVAGQDTYTVTSAILKRKSVADVNLTTGASVDVQVDRAVPVANPVLWARGYKGADARADFYVAPDDDGLELELTQDTDQKWVVVKFYYGSTLQYTSEPIDISETQPKIQIPKDKLRPNGVKYKVVLRNGFGDSASTETPTITNGDYSNKITITSARYNPSNDQLEIVGTGFVSGTTANPTGGATIDPSLLTVVDPMNISGGVTRMPLTNASLLKSSSTLLTLSVAGMGLEDREAFSGNDVRLEAEQGWYLSPTGQIADADTTGNMVTPMAYIKYGAYDRTNNRLTIYGAGFISSTIGWDKVTVNGVKLSTYGNSRVSDTQWYFTITSDVTGDDVVTQTGWSKVGSGSTTIYEPVLAPAPIYTEVGARYVSYAVVGGKGVLTITTRSTDRTGVVINPTLIRIMDISSGADITLDALTEVDLTATTIKLTLTTTQTTEYASTDPLTGFKGSDIYVINDAGWYTVGGAGGPEGAPVLVPQLRMPTK